MERQHSAQAQDLAQGGSSEVQQNTQCLQAARPGSKSYLCDLRHITLPLWASIPFAEK